MDQEKVLNWCVFAAICLISYSKETNSFPHSLGSSNSFRKISQSTKMIEQEAVKSDLQRSREKLEVAETLTRTRRKVRSNYDNHITTSNSIPRGPINENQLNESHVSSVVSDITVERNYNSGLSKRRYEHDKDDSDGYSGIARGQVDTSELGRGSVVKDLKPDDHIKSNDETSDYLLVIPLGYVKTNE